MGSPPREITSVFGLESIMVGVPGIVVGLFMGMLLANIVSALYDTELYRFPVNFATSNFVVAAVVMLLAILFAQLMTYIALTRLDWLDSLKTRE
ncbi:MAG: FtsX-like permease family protein [Planctomycetota bacterium]|nr:FtsX-like permease family protein [Planctomycetota bacterium]